MGLVRYLSIPASISDDFHLHLWISLTPWTPSSYFICIRGIQLQAISLHLGKVPYLVQWGQHNNVRWLKVMCNSRLVLSNWALCFLTSMGIGWQWSFALGLSRYCSDIMFSGILSDLCTQQEELCHEQAKWSIDKALQTRTQKQRQRQRAALLTTVPAEDRNSGQNFTFGSQELVGLPAGWQPLRVISVCHNNLKFSLGAELMRTVDNLLRSWCGGGQGFAVSGERSYHRNNERNVNVFSVNSGDCFNVCSYGRCGDEEFLMFDSQSIWGAGNGYLTCCSLSTMLSSLGFSWFGIDKTCLLQVSKLVSTLEIMKLLFKYCWSRFKEFYRFTR